MTRRQIIPAGVLGFALLCVACLWTHARSIQRGLWTRSTSALTAAGVHGVDLSFSGRDARLSGTVASQELIKAAGDTVIRQPGVRIVDNRLQVATLATEPEERSLVPRSGEKLQRLLDQQLAGKTIEFESASAVLSLRGRLVLDGLLPLLEAYPRARVGIGGHTDAQGSEAANLELSQRRASAVKQYLVDHGIGQSGLTSVGYGETRPIADNDTAAGRRENRRITFNILEGS